MWWKTGRKSKQKGCDILQNIMATVTPRELNKLLTALLQDMLVDTGFTKMRARILKRTVGECEQFCSHSFTRDRGLPGNLYTLTCTISFSFSEVDRLTNEFLGREYDKRARQFSTGVKPLYALVPHASVPRYKYCSDEALDRLAEMVCEDFRSHALPFFERYDTLVKLEKYFGQLFDKGNRDFHVVWEGRKAGSGEGCCFAAVLCLLEKWDQLECFLAETDLLMEEQREVIQKYLQKR